MGVARSLDWKSDPEIPKIENQSDQILKNAAPGLFLVLSLATLIFARRLQTS